MRRHRSVVVPLVALALAACGADDRPPIERAQDLVEDDGGFSTAIESGDTFAHVAELLLEASEDCDGSCPAVRQAAAYAQVVAAEVLECSLPEIHDARRGVLDQLAAVMADPTALDTVPALPDC